jgi:hypothetical protein
MKGMHIVDVQEMISRTQDAATVKRVYGDPYEKGDVTIIPAARQALLVQGLMSDEQRSRQA